MEGELVSPAGGELAPPVIANGGEPAPTNELENPVIGGEPGSPPPEGVEDELVEFEFGHKKYANVPKSLRENVSKLNAAYTQHKQTEAERLRELDERQARIEQQSQATEDELSARAQLHHVTSELKRFENYTWAQYQQHKLTDPAAAEDAWAYVQHLERLKTQSEGKVSEAQRIRSESAQSDMTKRVQETFDWAQKNIKGWNKDVDSKVFAFADSHGVSQQFLGQYMSPALYGILHKAMIGDAALKRSTVAPTPGQPQPLQTVGARSNPASNKPLAEMDMEEYVAARKAGRKG